MTDRIVYVSLFAVVLCACSQALPKQPPGQPPSPKTITREEPGGDAHDPHEAALDRLLKEPWGWRNDKKDVFRFPLTDWKNWRRVRFWGVSTFVGFRYGDKHRAVTGMWLRRLRPEDREDPAVCMSRFEEWGMSYVDAYGAHLKNISQSHATWRSHNDVVVKRVEAEANGFLSNRNFIGVIGATIAWPSVCAVYGYAFEERDSHDLAEKVRDRYAIEAFKQLHVNSPSPPDGIE